MKQHMVSTLGWIEGSPVLGARRQAHVFKMLIRVSVTANAAMAFNAVPLEGGEGLGLTTLFKENVFALAFGLFT